MRMHQSYLRTMERLAFLIVLLYAFSCEARNVGHSSKQQLRLRLQAPPARPEQRHRSLNAIQFRNKDYKKNDPDKKVPQKTNCSKNDPYAGATRWWDNDGTVDAVDETEQDACNETLSDNNSANRISISFWVATLADTPSLGVPLTTEVTLFLNTTLAPEVVFHLGDNAGQQQKNDTSKLDDDDDATTLDLSIYSRVGYDSDYNETESSQYQVVSMHTNSNLVWKNASIWWWQYDVLFACFWDNSYLPLMNQTILDVISAKMTRALTSGIFSGGLLNYTRQFTSTRDLLGLAINASSMNETVLLTLGQPAPSTEPPTVSNGLNGESGNGQEEEPLDVHSWDALRYVGLGVFVGTIVLTSLCMAVASYRQHALRKKSVWGNVKLDEAGVNELLKTGWKIEGQRTVRVFDKHRIGYHDDDSVLIGGYEQRGACAIGGEIVTVTQSETTPNTWSEQRDRVRY